MTGRAPQAGILGTGLIGGSIGLGLAAAGWGVIGWDPDPACLDGAVARAAIARAASRPEVIAGATDLLVLAGPPDAVIADLPNLVHDGLVIDVSGVKGPVVVAAGHLPHFVGTHPMAGREVSGIRAASAALFRGAAWVLVTDGAANEDVDRAADVVRLLDADPVVMTAGEHDRAVAAISHLPQVLAAALLEEAGERPDALRLAAGSFRDLTRVAASAPLPWSRLLLANRAAVAEAIDEFRSRLDVWAAAIDGGDGDGLALSLGTAQQLRRGLAPPVVAVRVALADQPGELARVGHALEDSGVDVRDLQLRHAPHGGGGVLTLSVRPGEAEALRHALAAQDLLLTD